MQSLKELQQTSPRIFRSLARFKALQDDQKTSTTLKSLGSFGNFRGKSKHCVQAARQEK